MCGGTRGYKATETWTDGLSPRVRGNRADVRRPVLGIGSIPACAGEPGLLGRTASGSRVYPRVCGGTDSPDLRFRDVTGLSPRVRGNLPIAVGLERGNGSIPACAGEPPCASPSRIVRGVYPRVCGGTGTLMGNAYLGEGLSPRVRGNRLSRKPRLLQRGSIPACAGEPDVSSKSPEILWVYPRVCGGTGT